MKCGCALPIDRLVVSGSPFAGASVTRAGPGMTGTEPGDLSEPSRCLSAMRPLSESFYVLTQPYCVGIVGNQVAQ